MSEKDKTGEKRKQVCTDAVSVGDKKAREGATATDDEVEEFFEILRRIHVAVRYFKNNGEKLTAVEVGSDAMLEWATDRTEEDASGVDGGDRAEVTMDLDLNLYPVWGKDDPV